MLKWLGGLVDSNEKQIQRLRPLVKEINDLETEYKDLNPDELRAKTTEFKTRLQSGETLDDILPEAFAAVREAARRTIGQRHFDVQLMGGIVLHQGKIAEMRTGEGKTLTATLPLYLNSLDGKGCHLVTVNDYLSKRDAHWMGPVYHALGVSTAAIHSQTPDNQSPSFVYDPAFEAVDKRWSCLRPVNRREAYMADITYGTNNEFGFDYLRDNMVIDLEQCVQRELNYAIVDEVDNLLIDEARTPLIISGPAPADQQELYSKIDAVVRRMEKKVLPRESVSAAEKEEEESLEEECDYVAYEKTHNVRETQRGAERLAKAFGKKAEDLFPENLTADVAKLVSAFHQSMLAHAWYQKDHQYVVLGEGRDRSVVIVDEFTGRLMHGRRYSEGLHQAIEAKENVKVQRESLTYATITFQNYFRMYEKLAGMTGTAQTEAEEFHKIYELEVVQIPTNKAMIRQDSADRIYKDEKSKFGAVVKEVVELNQKRRPILIGTVSIEKSEMLSEMLKRKGVSCKILNAKPENAQREADIVAEAGRLKAVTVATNMAGRGVDIILGGNPDVHPQGEWRKEHDEVVSLGGLHIIGTERHEARRIDNQLRGRAGRQGDPGSSRFYVSLEDDIMKRFGGDRIRGLMEMAGMDEDTPIENRLVNRAIESAQVRTEGFHFDIRKHLVEFDDVVNKQRELIYDERRKILSGADLKANVLSMVKEEIHGIVASHSRAADGEGPDVQGILTQVGMIFPLTGDVNAVSLAGIDPEGVEEKLVELSESRYDIMEGVINDPSLPPLKPGTPNMRYIEQRILLGIIDRLWVEHLTLMDERRREAGWATLQQVKAVDAYKNLGGEQWDILKDNIRHEVAHTVYHVSVRQEAPRQAGKPAPPRQPIKQPAPSLMSQAVGARTSPQVQQPGGQHKVGRNDPCPCGSGKKYKHCHGK